MVRIAILRLLESYFRHRWLYLLPLLIFIVAGAIYVSTVERKYVSGGILYVQNDSYLGSLTSVRDSNFSWLTPAQTTSAQISDLLQTDSFVRSLIEDTRLESKMSLGDQVVFETIDEVRNAFWLYTIGDNQVGIQAFHENPQVALELSSAAVDRYIQWQINLDRVQSGAAEDFMADLIVTYEADLEVARSELTEYLMAHPAPLRGDRPELEQLEINRIQGKIQLAGQRYSSALEREESARLATAQAEADIRQTYFIVDAPLLPKNPNISLRQLAMSGMVFVVVGIIFSSVGIAGSALLDNSFRFPVDVHHVLDLPVLSMVSDMRPKTSRLSSLRQRIKGPAKEERKQNITGTITDEDVLEAVA